MDGRAHSARGPGCSALSCPQPSTSPHAPQAPSQKRDSSLPAPKQGRCFFLFCKNCSAPPPSHPGPCGPPPADVCTRTPRSERVWS